MFLKARQVQSSRVPRALVVKVEIVVCGVDMIACAFHRKCTHTRGNSVLFAVTGARPRRLAAARGTAHENNRRLVDHLCARPLNEDGRLSKRSRPVFLQLPLTKTGKTRVLSESKITIFGTPNVTPKQSAKWRDYPLWLRREPRTRGRRCRNIRWLRYGATLSDV